ncbi:hypothetical protein L3X38_042104 [Prunus dulcis]|uniref:Uncharacterized protein n=1 Tax=Prunus dulcis TaxID=3755 RepID=A0AAD4UTY3_PRUDU|nr:hypothetical protein L3X38_042104 [Prunus dulcis]
MHEDLVVAGIGVHEAEELRAGRGVHQLVDSWQQEAILWACFVQICIILAHSPGSTRLLYQNRISKPDRVGYLTDETDCSKLVYFEFQCFVPFGIIGPSLMSDWFGRRGDAEFVADDIREMPGMSS